MYFLPSANYGSSVLIYKNYKFWINNRLKNSLSWACSYRKRLGCQCRVVTTRNGNFLSVHSEHNHPPRWYGRPDIKNVNTLTVNLEFDEYMKAYTKYSKRSWVRMYYSKSQGICCCKFCNSRIKDSMTSTGNLIRHIRNAHVDVFEAYKNGDRQAIKHFKELIQEIDIKNKKLGLSSDDEDACPKEKKLRSWIWTYFVKGTDMCVCRICATELRNNKNSTGNLIRHIKLKHQEIYKDLSFDIDQSATNFDINFETDQDPLPNSPEESNRRSWVWLYFRRNGATRECKICDGRIKVMSGVHSNSTSNLIRHLRRHHHKLYLAYKNENSKVIDYYKKAVKTDIHSDEDENNGSSDDTKSYEEHKGKSRKGFRSKVWGYFTKNKSGTVCKMCKKTFHTAKATGTSNLLRHLRVKHGLSKSKSNNHCDKKDDKEWVWQLISNESDEDTYKCHMCDQTFDKTLDQENDLTVIYDHMNSDHGVISAIQIVSEDLISSKDETKEQDNEISTQASEVGIQDEVEIDEDRLRTSNIKIITAIPRTDDDYL